MTITNWRSAINVAIQTMQTQHALLHYDYMEYQKYGETLQFNLTDVRSGAYRYVELGRSINILQSMLEDAEITWKVTANYE